MDKLTESVKESIKRAIKSQLPNSYGSLSVEILSSQTPGDLVARIKVGHGANCHNYRLYLTKTS